MHLQKFRQGILITLLTLLPAFNFKFNAPLTAAQVLAQTPEARKAEADRLFQQGNQQYQTSAARQKSLSSSLNLFATLVFPLKGLGHSAVEVINEFQNAICASQQRFAIA